MFILSGNLNRVFFYYGTCVSSYLPLLPVLELLEGRAGVWAFDKPADRNQSGNKYTGDYYTAVVTTYCTSTRKCNLISLRTYKCPQYLGRRHWAIYNV